VSLTAWAGLVLVVALLLGGAYEAGVQRERKRQGARERFR